MKSGSFALLSIVLGSLAAPLAVAQLPVGRAQPAGSGVQGASDVRDALVRSLCNLPTPPARPQRPFNFRPRPTGPFPYSVKAIPGVVADGAQWKLIWVHNGNNADGMVGQPDGSVLAAQNDDSTVVRITPDGHSSVVYEDTDTGGSLAENKLGQLFIAERSLIPSVWELAPERKLIADSYQGKPLECQGPGVTDSAVALHNGGVYFGYAGLYYASPSGQVTKVFDQDVNDAVLSPDETKLYMGSGGNLYVADVGPDGLLSNTHLLAKIPGGGNDGGAVDAEGRIYMAGYPGVRVFEPDGKYLGTIPAPRNLIDVVFSGPDKKTLFAVAYVLNPGTRGYDEVYTLPMIAQGYPGRGK
ncbi:MAG: SMP-30/gluconolactonase/LRE family protein [Steroidobacteraceae bacterium]